LHQPWTQEEELVGNFKNAAGLCWLSGAMSGSTSIDLPRIGRPGGSNRYLDVATTGLCLCGMKPQTRPPFASRAIALVGEAKGKRFIRMRTKAIV